MSLGLGHHYLVQIIYFESVKTIDEAFDYIHDHPVRNEHQWYEVRPIVDVKNGLLEKYHVTLVEFANKGKK